MIDITSALFGIYIFTLAIWILSLIVYGGAKTSNFGSELEYARNTFVVVSIVTVATSIAYTGNIHFTVFP